MEKLAPYEQDFLIWTQQQAEYLKKGYWSELDVKNLIEELESLGRSEQKELSSYLQVLVMHLLKCQYQPEKEHQVGIRRCLTVAIKFKTVWKTPSVLKGC